MIALWLLACTNDVRPITEIGNPKLTARSFSTTDWIGEAVVVESVEVPLGDVRFFGCDGAETYRVAGPFVAELVAGSGRDLQAFPEEEVCGVQVELGAGIVLTGADPEGRVFTVTTEVAVTASAMGDDPLPLGVGEARMLLGFDLAAWSAGVAIEGPVVDGSIQVAPDLFQTNLASVALLVDADRDSQVDPTELEGTPITSLQALADSDGDGLIDANEAAIHATDPDNADSDGDRLEDGEEVFVYATDPANPDSDGGGTDDGTEVTVGTDPLDPSDD